MIDLDELDAGFRDLCDVVRRELVSVQADLDRERHAHAVTMARLEECRVLLIGRNVVPADVPVAADPVRSMATSPAPLVLVEPLAPRLDPTDPRYATGPKPPRRVHGVCRTEGCGRAFVGSYQRKYCEICARKAQSENMKKLHAQGMHGFRAQATGGGR